MIRKALPSYSRIRVSFICDSQLVWLVPLARVQGFPSYSGATWVLPRFCAPSVQGWLGVQRAAWAPGLPQKGRHQQTSPQLTPSLCPHGRGREAGPSHWEGPGPEPGGPGWTLCARGC